MTKSYRFRIAAVFTANADFEFFAGLSAFCYGDSHERADPVSVDADKWIFRQDAVAKRSWAGIFPHHRAISPGKFG